MNWVVVLPFDGGQPLSAIDDKQHFELLESIRPDLTKEINYWAAGLRAPMEQDCILAKGNVLPNGRIRFHECPGNRNAIYDIVLSELEDKKRVARASYYYEPRNILSLLVTRAQNENSPDEEVLFEAKKYVKNLATHDVEEIRDALNSIIESENPAAGIRLAQEIGALEYMLPEVAETKGFWQKYKKHSSELFQHLLLTLDAVAKHTGPEKRNLRWAALLHDVGKPKSVWVDEKGRTHFQPGPDGQGAAHQEVGAEVARDILTRLKMPAEDVEEVCFFVAGHMMDDFDNKKGAKKFIKDMGGWENAYDMLTIRYGDGRGKPKQDKYEESYKTMLRLLMGLRSEKEEWEELSSDSAIVVVLKKFDII